MCLIHLSKYTNHYLQSRKKGLLKLNDCRLRLKFAQKQLKERPEDFWTNHIAMYLDGTSFVYKSNPHDQAVAPRLMAWRKRCEGLDINCTSKGKKTGSGGKVASFMVGISHGSGVVLCQQYSGRLNGEKFANMIIKDFPKALSKCGNNSKLILQDGCPVQNSAAALRAFKSIGADIFPIPARSPDINVIENFFRMMELELREQAINKHITHESFEEFSARVKETIMNISSNYIDKTIES